MFFLSKKIFFCTKL